MVIAHQMHQAIQNPHSLFRFIFAGFCPRPHHPPSPHFYANRPLDPIQNSLPLSPFPFSLFNQSLNPRSIQFKYMLNSILMMRMARNVTAPFYLFHSSVNPFTLFLSIKFICFIPLLIGCQLANSHFPLPIPNKVPRQSAEFEGREGGRGLPICRGFLATVTAEEGEKREKMKGEMGNIIGCLWRGNPMNLAASELNDKKMVGNR